MSEAECAAAHALLRASLVARAGLSEDPSDPLTVQAMQIVVHIPKTFPPRRSDVLAAVGSAVLKVCLDPSVAHAGCARSSLLQWYGHRIRKVTRRARGAAWQQVHEVPGFGATVNQASAFACFPTATSQVYPQVRKLQIRGTDLPADSPAPPEEGVVVYVDASLGMSLGKAAAQVGHAVMFFAAEQSPRLCWEWSQRGFAVSVREVTGSVFSSLVDVDSGVVVRDAGLTEIAPNSVTCVAFAQPVHCA
ncbi:aminoacyl-tRNA hydrolase [Corynebacterium felinum]|uniref:peptidyl-tRNA hydrolase n=1 Tax=Corynebacterium felinum TaxID=131318 RepID=A0ABU2B5X9_9CORY|nr:aminoacyl-tRNA hydrolase [Corynebacterium felinum]MDF5820314.1 aminoacyl-tRNA hydrolase [Corynebacterium felinum]MDR7353681.1 peptidyl-tRNA hydrolase [Corynebacterium felinum]WJY95860.1 peptidyl-tRNA hydrolase [Corynebacterium felinum]